MALVLSPNKYVEVSDFEIFCYVSRKTYKTYEDFIAEGQQKAKFRGKDFGVKIWKPKLQDCYKLLGQFQGQNFEARVFKPKFWNQGLDFWAQNIHFLPVNIQSYPYKKDHFPNDVKGPLPF